MTKDDRLELTIELDEIKKDIMECDDADIRDEVIALCGLLASIIGNLPIKDDDS